jgi:site-specific DNA-methyltransferase (adenine-specific)
MFAVKMGDVVEKLKTIDSDSVDAVLTDPPYNVKMAHWDAFKSNEEFGNWCYQWGSECFRILKPGGAILAFSAARTYHWMAWGIERAGFITRDMIEWIYWASFAKGKNLKPGHEPIYYGVKPPLDNIKFNVDDCRIPMTNKQLNVIEEYLLACQPTKPRADIWSNPNANVGKSYNSVVGKKEKGWKHTTNPPHPGGRVPYNVVTDYVLQEVTYPSTIIENKKPRGQESLNGHPTQKPIKLMEWLIKLVTNEGDFVVDCFAGSGTTAVAAELLGRDSLSIEKEAEYVLIIKDRLQKISSS